MRHLGKLMAGGLDAHEARAALEASLAHDADAPCGLKGLKPLQEKSAKSKLVRSQRVDASQVVAGERVR